jgi:hypothetical protein
MKPSVGRIVHYHTTSEQQGGRPFAAIITAADGNNSISLSVMTPSGGRFSDDLPDQPGQATSDVKAWWEWPPRVE